LICVKPARSSVRGDVGPGCDSGGSGLRLGPELRVPICAWRKAGQASVYVLRERGYLWRSRPAPVMLFASLADVAIVSSLAPGGVLMTPLAPEVVAMLFGATLAFALAFDGVKRIVLACWQID
jgi:hypothetical protein